MTAAYILRYLIGIVLCMALGCKHVHVLEESRYFDRARLVEGKVAIGGVTAMGGGAFVGEGAMARRLAEVLSNRFDGLEVMGPAEVQRLVKKEEYSEALAYHSETRRLDNAHLKAFCPVANRARYLLMVDLWSKRWKTVSRSSDREYRRYEDPETGEYVREVSRIEYETESKGATKVKLRAGIYDLRKMKSVWLVDAHDTQYDREYRRSYFDYPQPEAVQIPNSLSVVEWLLPKIIKKIPRGD